jgi:hypothetical protein
MDYKPFLLLCTMAGVVKVRQNQRVSAAHAELIILTFVYLTRLGECTESSLKLDPMCSTSVSLWLDGYSSSHYAALLLEVRHGLTTKLPG